MWYCGTVVIHLVLSSPHCRTSQQNDGSSEAWQSVQQRPEGWETCRNHPVRSSQRQTHSRFGGSGSSCWMGSCTTWWLLCWKTTTRSWRRPHQGEKYWSQQVPTCLSLSWLVFVGLGWSQRVSVGFRCSRFVSASLVFLFQMATHLPPDQAAIFLSLMTMEEQSFTPGDVLEAVRLNRDFPSALKFLTHSCPICQEQVSFSKVRDTSSESCLCCYFL